MADLQNDDEIVEALGLNEDEDRENLIYNRLFPFYYIASGTQTEVKTYILVEIDITEQRQRYGSTSTNIVYPTIIFTVLSHQDDMRLQLAGISAVRTDYIAELIDKKYNGKDGFGLKGLQVISNTASSLSGTSHDVYRLRQIVFRAADFNDSYCDG